MEATEFFYRVLNSWKFFPWYLGNFHSLLHNLVRRVFLFQLTSNEDVFLASMF